MYMYSYIVWLMSDVRCYLPISNRLLRYKTLPKYNNRSAKVIHHKQRKTNTGTRHTSAINDPIFVVRILLRMRTAVVQPAPTLSISRRIREGLCEACGVSCGDIHALLERIDRPEGFEIHVNGSTTAAWLTHQSVT